MIRNIARLGVAVFVLAACSSSSTEDTAPGSAATSADRPTIVVTTSILGDVVANLVGDLATVEIVMPNGASPHDFQPSAKQIAELRAADAVIANGAGFEEGLHDALESAKADGVPVYEAISAVSMLAVGEGGDHDHAGDEHAGDEHAGDEHAADEHAADEHGAEDPHFFTDPARMSDAVSGIVGFLATEVPALPSEGLIAQGDQYRGVLDALDASVEGQLASIAPERRKLVTNHEVFAYFADRYDFEVVGVVIAGGGTQGEPDAAGLAALAEAIGAADVPAIFADTSSPQDLADALADEVGGVEVVELYSESLGEADSGADTYVGMVQTNAARIAAALGS